MGDGGATQSADGRLLYANPRMTELLPPAQRDSRERMSKVCHGRSERAELELQLHGLA